MSSSKVGFQLAGHRYFRGFWLFCTPFRLPSLLCVGSSWLRLWGTHWCAFNVILQHFWASRGPRIVLFYL